MTPDTFVEEVIKDFDSRYSYLYQGTVYDNGGGDFSPVHESMKHWLRTTLQEALEQGRLEYIKSVLLDFHKARLDGAPGYDFFFKLSADLDALTKPNVESTPSQPD